MNSSTSNLENEAARITHDYFRSSLEALHNGAIPLAERMSISHGKTPLTRARLDDLVAPLALRTLELPDAPVYGAGFIAAIDLLADARSHLAWWQGDDRRQLVLSSQEINKEHIDYSELEWFRVPMATGEPHVAGPYVDYLCSDEYTMTVAVPTTVDGRRVGVFGLDLLVAVVERELTPRFASVGAQVTLVNGMGRVVVSTDPAAQQGIRCAAVGWQTFLGHRATGSHSKSSSKRSSQALEVAPDLFKLKRPTEE
ncbi:cache domain-containing protein [Tsukamurella tyrosinosolvens]|uniref:cache domain-containing protein n=1 Tax=Tsukamurella tyrosinosolvens TaxID=57704 RepID=UPI001881A960|nr:cache domain-containing protein [Tsukamurella tyrosinosolvens]